MRRFAILTCILFFTLTTALRSQNAPVTTIGSVTNAAAGPVTVPVSVTGFVNIGSISLTLDYNPAALTYSSALSHPSLSSTMSVNVVYPGRITISWFGTGITFPDNTKILDITFIYSSGTSTLTWFDNGASCQYSDGSFTVLNDSPFASYYFNGVVTNHPAPVTIAPLIINAVPGNVNVPVTVNGFTNIAAISLTLEYDQFVLTYQTITPHPSLSSGSLSATTSLVNGKMRLTISWFNLGGVTLPDASMMFTIGFNYTTANGINFSELNWVDLGGSCQYADGSYTVLYDSPTSQYYQNGLVSSGLSPRTCLPLITNAVAGPFVVPVTVDGFTNKIAAITLLFEYDPAVITYAGTFTKNPLLSGTMYVGDAPSTGGKRKVSIAWIGSSPGLANGSYLVNLNFTYVTGTTALSWLDDGTSCEYGDLSYQALYDIPQSAYYVNGIVTFGSGPKTIAASVLAVVGNPVHVPVMVLDFTNIGTGSLTLDYDPGVITYVSAIPHPSIATFFSATLTTPGRLTLSWFGAGTSVADNTELIGLNFTYNGGTTPLAWFDNGGSCQYSNGSFQVLYDQPQSTYYINGQVARQPLVADFSANNTLPQVGETVTFTDLSSGGPQTWSWSFSPSTCSFVNSTTSSSQNPQVQFTGNGKYSVMLLVTNAAETSSETKTWYIHVGTNGLWTGISSTDWYTESNWDNYLCPGIQTDVTIPATAPFWPEYTTDFLLGEECRSVTLVGNAQMDVMGSFMINPGSSLSFNGSGTFRLRGDWLNYGIFNCGNGSVEFLGTGPSFIPGGIYPASTLENYTRSTFTGALVPLTEVELGPAGDNNHLDVLFGFTFTYLGVPYSGARISTNGWLSLNQSGDDSGSSDNSKLFTSDNPNTTIAPWWDDLNTDGLSAISWIVSGTAPDRVFTAEWKNVLSYSGGATARITFQALLYESSGTIEFIYGGVSAGSHNALESASIGIEDATGGPGRFIDGTTGSMTDGNSALKSGINWPTSNFRYSPPPEKNTFYNLKILKTDSDVTNDGSIVVLNDLTIE